MAYNKEQFENLIKKTLQKMERYISKPLSPQSAINLLLGTCAVESQFGTYLRQLNDGPALGPFQMEPDTERDTWQTFITYRKDLKTCLQAMCGATGSQPERLETDLVYAIVMARVKYLRVKLPLPPEDNIPALGAYWKVYWNSHKGAGKIEDFIRCYQEFVRGDVSGKQRPQA